MTRPWELSNWSYKSNLIAPRDFPWSECYESRIYFIGVDHRGLRQRGWQSRVPNADRLRSVSAAPQSDTNPGGGTPAREKEIYLQVWPRRFLRSARRGRYSQEWRGRSTVTQYAAYAGPPVGASHETACDVRQSANYAAFCDALSTGDAKPDDNRRCSARHWGSTIAPQSGSFF